MTNFLYGQKILHEDRQGGELWISGISFISNWSNLHHHHISAVGSICQNYVNVPSGVIHHQWEIEDHEDESILEILKQTNGFIDKMRKQGRNVLIHCIGGISRSGAVVIGYLMQKYGYGFDDCERRVKEIRPFIKLNKGFRNQLREYQEWLNKAKL